MDRIGHGNQIRQQQDFGLSSLLDRVMQQTEAGRLHL